MCLGGGLSLKLICLVDNKNCPSLTGTQAPRAGKNKAILRDSAVGLGRESRSASHTCGTSRSPQTTLSSSGSRRSRKVLFGKFPSGLRYIFQSFVCPSSFPLSFPGIRSVQSESKEASGPRSPSLWFGLGGGLPCIFLDLFRMSLFPV